MSVFGQDLKSRFAVLGVVIVLVLGALLVRLWSMQIISGESFAAQSENNRIREVTIPAARGRIFDAKGRPLVVNRPTLAVTVAPAAAKDKAMLARLSTLLNMTVADIGRHMASTKLQALQPRVIAIDVPLKAVSYISEHADLFPGVAVQTIPVREYPDGQLAAHILGYVGEISDAEMKTSDFKNYALGDVVGKAGVEREYESVLQGEKGYQRLEVDAKGRVRAVLDRREPVPGRDIKLTVDIDVQKVAEKALSDSFAEAHRQGFVKANAGAIVVMDVKSGAIVAMASAPTFDPRKFVRGISQKDWQSLNATASEYPLNDRAVMSQYPPASTFKVITGLAALQQGFVTASTAYDCPYTWRFPGHENSKSSWWVKHDWNPAGHGVINFTQAVEQSADTYFYPLGYKFWQMPGERLQAFARAVGYGSKTGIDLPSEAAGRVPDAAWKKRFNNNQVIAPEFASWVPGDTVNMAIGQGDLLVTPLQMATVFGGVANGGDVLRPHVLQQVMARGGSAPALQAKPTVVHKVPASSANIALMQSALLGVTENGTGKSAFASFSMKVAGKTGTAQVNAANLSKSDPRYKDDYAWFAGYAPADAPRYSVAVVIEQGGHGGSVAAPAAREVLAALNGLPVTYVSATDASR